MIKISPLLPEDRADWEVLARAYKAFYKTTETDEAYDLMWSRLLVGDEVRGFAARLDGRLVGITHYLFHASGWSAGACYLQDLYVDGTVRGQGIARALIESVAQETQKRGLPRLYWTTQQDNTTARILYDKVAAFNGFIRYDYPVGG
jgi:GNAT superfamily N-acetyltransferase